MNNLTDTQKQLLNLLSVALFNREREEAEYNWDELKQEALDQTVFSLIYPVVKDLIPEDKKAEWESLNARIIANNLMVDYEHAELHELMTENNIPYVVLKGFSSAYYYPDPMLRMMGDVDFLVAEEDVERAGKLLEREGFIPTKEHHNFHIAYHRQASTRELHYSVAGIPEGKCSEIVKKELSDIVGKSTLISKNNIECNLPSEFHHGLTMVLHIIEHLVEGAGIGLRHICDWAVYVDKIDIAKFKPQYSQMGLWTFVCQLTALSAKYLGLKKLDWCTGFEDNFLKDFLVDIVSAGNFGMKCIDRGSAINIVNKSNLIYALAHRTRRYFAFTRNHPILLPFGMVAYFCRFVWLRLSGKRNWLKIGNVREAKDRKVIYDLFRLFEV